MQYFLSVLDSPQKHSSFQNRALSSLSVILSLFTESGETTNVRRANGGLRLTTYQSKIGN